MKTAKLHDMVKGWFVGKFEPTAFSTDLCEVAVKNYHQGDYEKKHHHQIATEITLILSGKVKMMDQVWSDGDIVVLSPGEATDFLAITDAINIVVKVPGALNDKFMSDDHTNSRDSDSISSAENKSEENSR